MKKAVLIISIILLLYVYVNIYIDIIFFNNILFLLIIYLSMYLFFLFFFKEIKGKNYIIFIVSLVLFFLTFKFYNVDFKTKDKAILSLDSYMLKSNDTLLIYNTCNTYLLEKKTPLIYRKQKVFISIMQSKLNNTGNDVVWLYSMDNEIIKVDRKTKVISIRNSVKPLKDNIYYDNNCDNFIKNFIE